MFKKRLIVFAALVAVTLTLASTPANAQCGDVLVGGLRFPIKLITTQKSDLLVAEAGFGMHTGRISIVDRSGARRTLIDGLPSGFSPPEGGPSGPSGLAVQGRTLYVTIGEGDNVVQGPGPGALLPNPNPTSPIFSSVLAIHFSANVEKTTEGFTLTLADQVALSNGETVVLTNGSGDKATVELVSDFTDHVPSFRPDVPQNVRQSNPFGVAVQGKYLYVVDPGMNLVYKVDSNTGETSTLTTFGPVANTRPFGPPVAEAVPDSVRLFGDQLLVTLLTGFPFPIGSAEVRNVDIATGTNTSFITGLTSAIDVLPVKGRGGASQFFVLEFSTDMLLNAPGRLLLYDAPTSSPSVIADCLISPTSLAFDPRSGAIFVTEVFTGRIIELEVP